MTRERVGAAWDRLARPAGGVGEEQGAGPSREPARSRGPRARYLRRGHAPRADPRTRGPLREWFPFTPESGAAGPVALARLPHLLQHLPALQGVARAVPPRLPLLLLPPCGLSLARCVPKPLAGRASSRPGLQTWASQRGTDQTGRGRSPSLRAVVISAASTVQSPACVLGSLFGTLRCALPWLRALLGAGTASRGGLFPDLALATKSYPEERLRGWQPSE